MLPSPASHPRTQSQWCVCDEVLNFQFSIIQQETENQFALCESWVFGGNCMRHSPWGKDSRESRKGMATTAAGAGEVGRVALALVPQGHIQWTWSRLLVGGNTQESQGPHWWDSRWG